MKIAEHNKQINGWDIEKRQETVYKLNYNNNYYIFTKINIVYSLVFATTILYLIIAYLVIIYK